DRLGLGRDHELETTILLPHALARRDDQPDHRRVEERARAQVDEQAAVRARARERVAQRLLRRQVVLTTQRGDADIGCDGLHLDGGPAPALVPVHMTPLLPIRLPAYASPASGRPTGAAPRGSGGSRAQML